MAFESCRINQHHYECLLHISFLFKFLDVNISKHNDKKVFHLDLSSTLIIASHPSYESGSCQNFQPLNVSLPFPSFF
jgi:hypothetical protein